jgi:hypothetical protein
MSSPILVTFVTNSNALLPFHSRLKPSSRGLHQSQPLKWVPGPIIPGVKRPGHEADHSLPSSVQVKNASSHVSTLHGVAIS